MFELNGSPYSLNDNVTEKLLEEIHQLEKRVDLFRHQGILTAKTLKRFYGEKRFEQVAESNAIEGSTLSVGETELAVLKGVTITGHDPGYTRDAISLDKALQRLGKLAQEPTLTNIEQLKEIHELILGDRKGSGLFRNQPVLIRGSHHLPPKTWQEVMAQIEDWEKWSLDNANTSAIIRTVVLHAWLAHIHPFIDGNGRCARAISNLELIRAGYPSIIIKKKERDRYIDAISRSDSGGDLSDFFELFLSKVNNSLTGLELSAKEAQSYSPTQEKLRRVQEKRLNIWHTSVTLLIKLIEHELESILSDLKGKSHIKVFEEPLELDDYIKLCSGSNVPMTWSFIINISIPSLEPLERLAWFGHRSTAMYQHLRHREEGGPSIFWSIKNSQDYPPWIRNDKFSPEYIELTTIQSSGDEWYAMNKDGTIERVQTIQLAKKMTNDLVNQIITPQSCRVGKVL
ncbi:MAG: Fic family protein [Thiomargarita sp.]|nr:Fic family protein [Thiomargarita sp.]